MNPLSSPISQAKPEWRLKCPIIAVTISINVSILLFDPSKMMNTSPRGSCSKQVRKSNSEDFNTVYL